MTSSAIQVFEFEGRSLRASFGFPVSVFADADGEPFTDARSVSALCEEPVQLGVVGIIGLGAAFARAAKHRGSMDQWAGAMARLALGIGASKTRVALAVLCGLRQLPADPIGGVTYFVEGGGLIKIGKAASIRSRLAGLRGSSPVPLKLLGVIPGQEHEAALHLRFSSARRHGEWFEPTPELVALIASEAIGAVAK